MSELIGVGLALGSAIISSIASASQNNKARNLVSQQKRENDEWYKTKMSSDYTQRSDAQALLNKQREMLAEQYKRARATNAVAGGSEESLAAQKQVAAQTAGDTITNIASQASAYKDNVEQQYRATDNALTQQQVQTHQQQAKEIARAGAQAVNAGVSLIGASTTGGAGSLKNAKDAAQQLP